MVEIVQSPNLPAARGFAPRGRDAVRVAGVLASGAVLAVVVLLSLAVGARPIAPGVVLEALTAFDPTVQDHLVVHDLRLPRTFIAIAVGMALGIAGALMQALTRNPLADPGLLGVNAGAAFAVVIAIWVLHVTGMETLVWFALAGAGAVAVVVYLLGAVGRGGATPVRLALAGSAVSALLSAMIAAVLLLSSETLDTYRFWMVGSLAGAERIAPWALLPILLAGAGCALLASRALNAVALGDDAALALGTKLGATRVLTLAGITLCSGGAVAAAGPIGFVGLVVPHVAKAWCGPDQRWLVVSAALLGGIVLVGADVVGRVILPPGEVQAGIMTALLGAPVLVAIVRNIRLGQP